MPVSGLVLLLADDPRLREDALRFIDAHPHLEVGPSTGGHLPVVLSTSSVRQDQEAFQQILSHPSITSVQVVFVDQSDVDSLAGPELQNMGRGSNRRARMELS